ncbi:MAG: serine hydrolase [Gammaproteobacteria bacterium]|nr:serine hydrolase [Gammaproteobacteria bacterium]
MLEGTVHPEFAEVASTLRRGIPRSGRGGAAVCVYHRGRCVVDLWGGSRDGEGSPWREDTVCLSFSTTKGVASTLLHILVEQGRAAYDDPVTRHWPEFGAQGKDSVTIRQLLCHEAGLYRIADMVEHPDEMLDWEHMIEVVANAAPVHVPGAMHGYHALTYGWLAGGLIESIAQRPFQQVLREELVEPLSLEGMFIGMPPDAMARRATLLDARVEPPELPVDDWRATVRERIETVLSAAGIELPEFRASLMPFSEPFDWNGEAVAAAVIPAANGHFTARALARMYAMIANGGELDGASLLSRATVAEIGRVQNRGRDKVLFVPMQWRLGYHRAFVLGSRVPDAFGHYGYGSSGAFCDPSRNLAVAMVVNSGAASTGAYSRLPRLAGAAVRAVDRLRFSNGVTP